MSLDSESRPTRAGRRRRWTRDAIVAALDAWHQQHLRSPAAWEWWSAGPDHPSHWTVRKVFGSWSAALSAAGLRARARGEVRVRTQRERCTLTGRFVSTDTSARDVA